MNNAQLALEKMQRDAQRRSDEAAEAKRKHVQAQVNYTLKDVNPFARRIVVNGLPFSNDGWRFSDHQAKVLAESGIDPKTKTYRQGCAIYWSLMKKPSPRMTGTLIKFGYSVDEIKAMSRKEAHQTIDSIEKNGWKRLEPGQAARLAVVGKDL